MDRDVIEQKLESLRRCVQRIQAKCPAQADALVADFDLQDIVSLNLSRGGFRNIAVHNYEAINWHIVHSIAKDQLDEFAEFAKAVVAWLGPR